MIWSFKIEISDNIKKNKKKQQININKFPKKN